MLPSNMPLAACPCCVGPCALGVQPWWSRCWPGESSMVSPGTGALLHSHLASLRCTLPLSALILPCCSNARACLPATASRQQQQQDHHYHYHYHSSSISSTSSSSSRRHLRIGCCGSLRRRGSTGIVRWTRMARRRQTWHHIAGSRRGVQAPSPCKAPGRLQPQTPFLNPTPSFVSASAAVALGGGDSPRKSTSCPAPWPAQQGF